jgi:hypothetical protein
MPSFVAFARRPPDNVGSEGNHFHVGEEDLPLGARLMAVANVFTGITDSRK